MEFFNFSGRIFGFKLMGRKISWRSRSSNAYIGEQSIFARIVLYPHNDLTSYKWQRKSFKFVRDIYWWEMKPHRRRRFLAEVDWCQTLGWQHLSMFAVIGFLPTFPSQHCADIYHHILDQLEIWPNLQLGQTVNCYTITNRMMLAEATWQIMCARHSH